MRTTEEMCESITFEMGDLFGQVFDSWLAEHDAEVYQRGREEAAKNVEAVAEPFFLTRFNPIDEDAWAVFVNILATARGDGA